jgi:hypothetical protein
MKTKLFALAVLIVAASCSAPKYTYNFSYYDYQAGKRAAQKEAEVVTTATPETFVASTIETPTLTTFPAAITYSNKSVTTMTRAEQKVFAKEVKKDIKNAVRQVKKMNAVQSAQAMDNDLKMAAIFGAIGVGLSILFGVSEIIGFIGFAAVVIALVFLIKWLLRQ